jgi:hypothetical protein
MLAAAAGDHDKGKHVAPNNLTLAQRVTDWLALKERSTKARTVERYSDIVSHHITALLGEMLLQKITARDIDKLYSGLTLGPNRAAASCRREAAFRPGSQEVLANPVTDADKPARDDDAAEAELEVSVDEEDVVAKRIGDDPATLLRSYARRTKNADANAAKAIAALSKGVPYGASGRNWVVSSFRS